MDVTAPGQGWLVVLEPLTRDGARAAAHRELSRGVYQAQRPSPLRVWYERALNWLLDAFDRATHLAPGGIWGLLALLVVVVSAVVAIRLRAGALSRTARADGASLNVAPAVSAEEHRRRAEAHATAGRYAEAIRERLRALVADLERRALLEPRPGRTADEMAAEAGRLLPAGAAALRRSALLFDEVWYGARSATPAMYAEVRAADDLVRSARPTATVAT